MNASDILQGYKLKKGEIACYSPPTEFYKAGKLSITSIWHLWSPEENSKWQMFEYIVKSGRVYKYNEFFAKGKVFWYK